jgi:hypothetical protein
VHVSSESRYQRLWLCQITYQAGAESMTPYEATLLIHFYVMACDFEQNGTELYRATCDRWIEAGVIEDNLTSRNEYKTTSLGEAWVHDMLNTPIPKTGFVGRNGDLIQVRAE